MYLKNRYVILQFFEVNEMFIYGSTFVCRPPSKLHWKVCRHQFQAAVAVVAVGMEIYNAKDLVPRLVWQLANPPMYMLEVGVFLVAATRHPTSMERFLEVDLSAQLDNPLEATKGMW